MEFLDTTTLRVVFAVVAVTLLGLFYFVTFQRTRSVYSAWWCAALALFLTGSAAYLLDGTAHQVWANPTGNALLVLGAASVWAGARTLRARGPRTWQLLAGPLVTLLASALDSPATNDWSGGPVFLGFMCLFLALASAELWAIKRSYSRVTKALALASGLLAVYYLGRWLVFLVEGPDGPTFTTYFDSAITTLITLVLLVVVSFSMAALSNEQVTRDLHLRATRDGLTGLLNRSGFDDLAVNELKRIRGNGTPGALVLADLDHFKTVNDTHGHAAGDVVLQAFADICVGTVRSTDLVGRHGGEEFVILLSGADANRAETIVNQLSARFALATFAEGFEPPTVSYGIASVDAESTDLAAVIATADAALYEAKSLGRNRAVQGSTGRRG
ncbi:GGDEF domain-containing protein [Arthrobacter tumbae]|uniref:GGDEF domain-containing protein n=1 Tax=Arthrobacter tumbae TaxID=163874 RepID=UPI0019595B6E|nr:GGDEF domain-containing protein [Arthrobacter tumbae]MBM7780784.1 diguanylate cyclase (GGDEF)-like protein [Arthrobacter tumbae]